MKLSLLKHRWKKLDKQDKLLISIFILALPIDIIVGIFSWINQDFFTVGTNIAIFFLDIYFLAIIIDETEILRKFTTKFH